MATLLQMVGASFVFVQLIMLTLWIVYFQRRNAGVVDVGWAVGFLVTMLAYFFLGEGNTIKKLMLLVMVALWAGRLSVSLYQRLLNSPPDPRYQELSQRWGSQSINFKFFVLFVFQGVLVTFLSLPFLIVSCCSIEAWTGWEVVGILVWGIGFLGESIADNQLQEWKKTQQKGVYDQGLWQYSRHPNYFFEWLVWLGYAIYAVSSPMGIFAFLSPLVMYYLLRHVSGVPLTEAHLERVQGDEYRHYQTVTSEFFPWFSQKEGQKDEFS